MSRAPRLVLPGEPPRIIAHRGFAIDHPENTIAAFRAAVEAGARGIELDIHLSASLEAVIFHDFTLERLHGDRRAISGVTSEELAHFGIPRLEELFAAFGDRIFYDVEIKSRDRGAVGLEAEAIRLIRRYRLEKRVLLSSFNPRALRTAASIAPEIPRGIIFSKDREVPFLLRRGWGRFAVSVSALKPRFDLVTEPWMGRLADRYAVLPWTVDDPPEAIRLAALGVDGIITNQPVAVAEALSKR